MDTGTRRRRAGEWRGLVQEWRKSGETRDAFASARGVKPTTLGWWASELTRRSRLSPTEKRATQGEPAMFLPVRVVGEAPGPRGILAFDARPREVGPATSERYAEIALGGGRVLRIPLGADAAWVGQLVMALQAGDRC